MREAKAKYVKWPDVDEKTFVHFTEWAYKGTYETEEPDILLDLSLIGAETGPTETQATPEDKKPEESLYSLVSTSYAQTLGKDCCWNESCASYGNKNSKNKHQAKCLSCLRTYRTPACQDCCSVYTDCPNCGPLTNGTRPSCLSPNCDSSYGYDNPGDVYYAGQVDVNCLRCRTPYGTSKCGCGSVFSDCPTCGGLSQKSKFSKRQTLIHKFLNEITSEFSPQKNKEGCEGYTEVFLCHAKLYVMADIYDIPALKQLTLHRLHATLKEFTLYPSRMNDIATLAKYVFENTVPEDKIRDMMTLYYACIIEDAWKHDGLKSVIDGVPDFAFGLISQMSDRLA